MYWHVSSTLSRNHVLCRRKIMGVLLGTKNNVVVRTLQQQSHKKFVGALDQGTSSTRFVIFDSNGDTVSSAQKEHEQIYPQPGWVEQRPQEIWDNSVDVITQAMEQANLQASDVASIGITNQRETTVVWDKHTGTPLHNAVVWNCGRTSEIVTELQERLGGQNALREITGLPISTYFSGTKLRWLFDHVDGVQREAQNGNALFGTIDCWLTWKLTNGKRHATDVTNASRTLLCDVGTLKWDDNLLKTFNVPASMLPQIEPSIGGNFGIIDKEACPILAGVPIGAILGDQHAATFGQACFTVGEAKCTFGTGAFIMMNMGTADPQTKRPLVSKEGLLTTPFYQQKGQPAVYALEGAVGVAGSLIQWLRDNMKFGGSAKEIAELAASVPDAQGIRFVPAFNGLFAPHWREDARGIIAGLTFFHTKAHIARAAIDSASFQTAEVFDAMEKDSKIELAVLKVDGGMTANQQLLQFLSNLLDTEVKTPKTLETTAAGAAFAAGLSSGVWKSTDEIAKLWSAAQTVTPKISESERKELKYSWKKAIDRSMGWVE